MGIIISRKKFSSMNFEGLLKPIIYCSNYEDITCLALSLNKELAQGLALFGHKQRTMQIEKCFAKILAKFPDNVVLKDFDVLFNPDYKIDVLKIMINTCKVKPFSIIWPGILDGRRLIYAEEGFQDYKTYDVDAYDITCIV